MTDEQRARDAALNCANEACRNMDGELDLDAMARHFAAFASPPTTGGDVTQGEEHPLIERLLDAQQDINFAANCRMDQSLCDASALIDEIEPILRAALATAQAAEGDETVAAAALRILLAEVNPAHAEQVRKGIRTIEESTIDGAAVMRAICNALHYQSTTTAPVSREASAKVAETRAAQCLQHVERHRAGGNLERELAWSEAQDTALQIAERIRALPAPVASQGVGEAQRRNDALATAFALLDSFAGDGLVHVYGNGQELDASAVCTELATAFGIEATPGWERRVAAALSPPSSPVAEGVTQGEVEALKAEVDRFRRPDDRNLSTSDPIIPLPGFSPQHLLGLALLFREWCNSEMWGAPSSAELAARQVETAFAMLAFAQPATPDEPIVTDDTKRIDFLDRCNMRLNTRYGTNYRWELILNHNVNRLMLGHMVVDLNDSAALGLPSCRDAIDAAMKRLGDGEEPRRADA